MVRLLSCILRNERGQTLLSNLVAAAVVGTAVVGTASLGNHLMRQSKRSQLLNRAVHMQSQVTSALLRKDQFDPNAHPRAGLAELRQGAVPAGLTLLDENNQPLATVGGRTHYDAQGRACNAPGPDCQISIDVDITCSGADPQCMAAYRVTVWPDTNSVQPAPLGASFHGRSANVGGSASFDPSDYMNPISYDAAIQDASSSCDGGAADILITGVNRVTGRVSCIKRSVTECPQGYVGKTVQAVGGHMEMVCTPLAKAECPDDYVMTNMSLAQLDRDPPTDAVVTGLSGQCTYRWLDNDPWQKDWPIQVTASSTTVDEQFCNDVIYRAEGNGTCSPVIDSDVPGTCYDPCPPCDVDGNCATCPRTVHSVANTTSSVNGARATCTLTITNECGSSMTAHPMWSGRCRTLNTQLTRPVK